MRISGSSKQTVGHIRANAAANVTVCDDRWPNPIMENQQPPKNVLLLTVYDVRERRTARNFAKQRRCMIHLV